MGAIASFIGLIAAARAVAAVPIPLDLPGQLPFGHFTLQMNGLSTLLVGIISLVSLAVSVYSISYLGQYSNRNLGMLGFFINLFIAMMLLVVTVTNAFYFLIFWEMMTLASYFLVISLYAGGPCRDSPHNGVLFYLLFEGRQFRFCGFSSGAVVPRPAKPGLPA
jgi:hydrogenase-4 component B